MSTRAQGVSAGCAQVPASELALRFNGALGELQLLGLIRDAGRRRREAAVQRLVFPMRAAT